jgi:hypothetical protein
MARKLKGRKYNSMADDRELIILAKTMTLNEIVRRTGRHTKGILRAARRLSVSIRGKPSKP